MEPFNNSYTYLEDLIPDIERSFLKLRLSIALGMLTEILRLELREKHEQKRGIEEEAQFYSICCAGYEEYVDQDSDCLVIPLIKSLHKVLIESVEKIKKELGIVDIQQCKFNIDFSDDEFRRKLEEELLNTYNISLSQDLGKNSELRRLCTRTDIGRNLCNSINICKDIPSILSSIANLITLILLNDLSTLGTTQLPLTSNTHLHQYPLWLPTYRYFNKRTTLCKDERLPYEMSVRAVAHIYGYELLYLLTFLLIYESYVDEYLDLNEMINVYRNLYLRCTSVDIVKIIVNLKQVLDNLHRVSKDGKMSFILKIIDYITGKIKVLHSDDFKPLELEVSEIQCLDSIISLLKYIKLFNRIGSKSLAEHLSRQNVLPYLLLHILLTFNAVPYLLTVIPSVDIKITMILNNKRYNVGHDIDQNEIDFLFLGFLPMITNNMRSFEPSALFLEVKLVCNPEVSIKKLLDKHQLEIINSFNNFCKEYNISDYIKCMYAVAIPCFCVKSETFWEDSVPIICLENLVSPGKFIISLIESMDKFHKSNKSRQELYPSVFFNLFK